jgi:hypothetical protein
MGISIHHVARAGRISGESFRAYLLAEIVSVTDAVQVPGTDRNWIDVKRDIYLGHPVGEAV